MEKIKDIIICITTVSLLAGFSKNFVIEKFKPYVKLIIGFLILLLIAEPIITSLYDLANDLEFKEISSDSEDVNNDYSSYIDVFKKTLCASVEDFIVQNCDIARENISVDAIINSDDITNITIEKITVTVVNSDKTQIPISLIKSFYGCNAEVVYGD